MKSEFLKLCSDDIVCRVKLQEWTDLFSRLSIPSEDGFCVKMVSGKEFVIDKDHPFNGSKWADVVQKSIVVPSKESWAPLKTWIQEICHERGNCSDGIGNWQSTIKSLDNAVK